MKHGRRHARLKEQKYLERKDAPGYARHYEPMPMEPSNGGQVPKEAPEPLPLVDAVDRRSRHALRKALERGDAG